VRIFRSRTAVAAAVALVATALPTVGATRGAEAATARQPEAPGLLSPAPEPTGTVTAAAPGTVRSRWVTLDEDLLPRSGSGSDSDREIHVNAFADADFTGVVEKVTARKRSTSWSGTVASPDETGDVGGSFFAVRVGQTYLLHVATAEGTFQVSQEAGDTYRVSEIAAPVVTGDDAVEPPRTGSTTSRPQPPGSTPPGAADRAPADWGRTDSGTTDVLVVYTAAAQAAAGGQPQMAAQIQLGIDQANTAYANSGASTSLRLIGTAPTPTIEAGGNLQSDLSRLQTAGDGYYDEVHATREAVHADLVSLWISGDPRASGTCGLGYLGGYSGTFRQEFGFTAMYLQQCATANLTFAHEIGHNQGADHDLSAGFPPQTPVPYAHGYVDAAGGFITVMAYQTACSTCVRVPYFSNPAVLYNGRPTGDATANNALRISESAAQVAAYRQSQIYPGAVTITGKPRIRKTLTASAGTWLPGGLTFGYQWYADGAPIAGATGTTLKLGKSRVGKVITVTVTGSGGTYAPVAAGSAPVGPVLKKPFKRTTRPRLLGKAKVGRVLTVKVKPWKPEPKKYKYVWYRNGHKIKGQKDRTYRLKKKDKGKKVWVKVVARKKGYQTTDRTTRKVKVKKR
jgi:Metallo-peptidase family M12